MISQLSNVLAHRPLLGELTRSELRRQTAGRKLGWLWWMLDPLIMMLIYWGIVVSLFGRGERYTPYAVFILCALLPFKHFSDSVSKACTVLKTRESVIKSVPFPTMVLPISTVLAGFYCFLFGVGILLATAVGFDRPVTAAWVQLPFLMVLQLAVVIGLCLPIACIGVVFEDVQSLITHGTRILFYLSPTLYGLDMVQEAARKALSERSELAEWVLPVYLSNPFANLITGYREAIFYGRFLDAHHWWALGLETAVILLVGYSVYQYFDRRVIKFL